MRGTSVLLMLLPVLLIISCGKKEAGGSGSADSTAAMSSGDGGMTAEETANIALSREFVEKAISNADTAYVRAHTDANFVEHSPSPGQKSGVDGLIEWVMMNKSAFPDVKLTIENIFAKGDQVAIVSMFTGTNTGPMMGQPATGKAVSAQVVDVVRIKDGKMTEHWGQIDAVKMLTDLGMMGPMGEAPGAGAANAPAAGGEMSKDSAK